MMGHEHQSALFSQKASTMAIALAPKPQASRKRAPRPRSLVLLSLTILLAAGGVIGGLQLESLNTEQHSELQSLQQELKELNRIQGEHIHTTQKFDELRFGLEAKISELEERLKNRDGFLG